MSKVSKMKFSKEERIFMLERIVDSKDSIETESKSYKATERKREAWNKVTSDFNEKYPERKRTEEQIKDFWRRAKVSAKKEKAQNTRSKAKTGGGPPSKEISEESELVLMAIGTFNDPIKSMFDDDASDPQVSSDSESDSDIHLDFNVASKSNRRLKDAKQKSGKGKKVLKINL